MKFEITSADDRHFYLLKFYEYCPIKMSHSCQGINHKSRKLEKDFRDSSATPKYWYNFLLDRQNNSKKLMHFKIDY